jgi:serine/threonine protein kinase/tetratricopeptide (TPR) repeat protein
MPQPEPNPSPNPRSHSSPSTAASAHQRLRELFDRALDLEPSARAAFLDEACDGDLPLRRRVEALLVAAGCDDAFFASPTMGAEALPAPGRPGSQFTAGAEPEVEGVGSRIGPYRLLQLIGEGGFGSVFMAEQEEPVRRKVALKVIKLGMDTRQVVARFEQERQALALMDHPNIARVLDAGATMTGRPYFVMELVRGVPLTEYCDSQRLTARERLGIFLPICHAIQHAHQKGVIHRDIKPSNILVTMHDGRPVPKVIDFGIAKATSARLTEKTLFTEHRQLIGTPAYMSPEQAEMSGLDIDTRSDIYSLGVLLYELLTGTTPFDTRALMQAGYGEIQRVIREVDPPKPSTRVSSLGGTAASVAAQRRTEPARLGAIIRGDLDWIVMRALEKDRTRRYESAAGFAADVARHLAGEAVDAAPPSATYRLRKFVRRRRGLVVSLGAVGLALLVGLAGTTIGLVQAIQSGEAERKAREAEGIERKRAEATTQFLQEMITSIDPERAQGRELTVKELIDAAAGKLGSAFVEQPAAEATLRHTLAESYNQLGRFDEAKEQYTRSAEIRAKVLGPTHRETLSDRFGIAAATLQLGDVERAKTLLEEAYAQQSRSLGLNDADTLQTKSLLGFASQLLGGEEKALEIYREVLPQQVAVLGQGNKAALETMTSIADVLQDLGRLDEAERVARELVPIATRAQGELGAQKLVAESVLVSILNSLGRYAEAEPLARSVFEAKKKIYGPEHPQVYTTANVLAATLENLDRFDESIALLREASAGAERLLGVEHSATLAYLSNLARNLRLHGELDEAETILRRVLEISRRTIGENATGTLATMNDLGLLLLNRERPADAEAVLRPMAAGIEKAVPESHWMRGQALVNLARSLVGQSKFEEAEQLMLKGYERLASALPAGHDRRRIAADALADLYERWTKPEQAATWRAKEPAGEGKGDRSVAPKHAS